MPNRNQYDVAVVGAGPAGLFAAHEIVRWARGARVILFDRGPDLDTRQARERRGERTEDWLSGFGGAGLFIGGRMSLDGSNQTGSPAGAAEDRVTGLREEILLLLRDWGVRGAIQQSPAAELADAAERAGVLGLTWHLNYPALHLDAEERQACLQVLHSALGRAGVVFRQGVTIDRLSMAGQVWQVGSGQARPAVTRKVVLCPGHGARRWLAGVLTKLGLVPTASPSTGVRIEVTREALTSLTDLTPDPRLSADLPEGRFRTYAFVVGGRVTVANSDGTLRVTCLPGGSDPGPNTSFSVLWQAHGVQTSGSRRFPQPGRASLASLTASDREDTESRRGRPSLDVPVRDLRPDWPDAYWTGFREFLGRLQGLAPEVGAAGGVVYSPAVEDTWTYPLEADGRTALPGLFLAGDGAGVSQGAMAAAISGAAAGQAVARELKD